MIPARKRRTGNKKTNTMRRVNMEYFKLNNSTQMPMAGIGVFTFSLSFIPQSTRVSW